jgi:PAS domain S-box-containing protein
MAYPDALSLGLILTLAGLVFWLVTRWLSRVPLQKSSPVENNACLVQEGLQDHVDAVLVIQAGGKPIYANRKAQELFHLRENELPNLERLAKRIRPPDQFLNLCAFEQQTRFVLDGRLVEGTSFHLAVQPTPLMVVALRDPGLTASLLSDQSTDSAHMLKTYVELTQAMAASLELPKTIQAIFENIEKLIPADWMEITIWNANAEIFIPYQFVEMEGTERKFEALSPGYRVGEGYCGRIAQERQPLLISDLNLSSEKAADVERCPIPLRSYLGVPLIVGKEIIGTLALASMTVDAFRKEDLEVMRMLSGQAAVAVHNALLYQAEQQRTTELNGLAQLSQAFGSAHDSKTLFARLVQSILPLIQVEILGFLLYNENQRVLEGQAPFYGLPEQFLDLYQAPVPINSALEQALMNQDMQISENPAEDAHWESLGLGSLARGASLRETVLVPLNSGGRMLGYLQASNHTQAGQAFTRDELHLLAIVANQAAPVIDNLTLIQQSRQRAQRAEALRRIASLASSAANLNEILKFSIQELARLLGADAAGIFLLHPNESEIQFHDISLFGSLESLPEQLGRLRMDDPQFHFTVTGSQRALFSGSLSEEPAVIPFYQAIQSFWKVESVVVAPLIVRDEGIGELWLASREANFFDKGSLQVAATAAGQLAGVVEQSYLVAQTDESLRRRVEQLTALTRISHELSTTLDLKYLLQLVYDEALQTSRADCGTILLFDMNRPTPGGPCVRFFIGDTPAKELLPVEKSVLEKNEPLNIPNIHEAGYSGGHEGVQSVLLVPISYHQRQAGLMTLHSMSVGCFDATAVEISQSLAVQAAVVLGNALQYEEQTQHGDVLKRELETLGKLFDISRSLRPDLPLTDLLQAVAQAICAATPFQMAVISLYDAESGCLQRTCAEGLKADVWQELQTHQQAWSVVCSLLQPEYKIGSVYYISKDGRPQTPTDLHVVTILPEIDHSESGVWDAKDLLLVPLFDPEGSPLGLISVDGPRDGRQPDWQTCETLELFALQAAAMIQNYTYISRLEERANSLEVEAEESRRRIPELLSSTQEQSKTLLAIQQQVERMHGIFEVAEQANRQPDRLTVLQTVARELLARFGMQLALLAEKTPSGIQLMDVIGVLPPGVNPKALFGQRNPLRQILQDGKLLLISDVETEPGWQNNTFLAALSGRSAVGMVLAVTDGGPSAALLLIGSDPLPPFEEEDLQAFEQLMRQVRVGLQNLELLTQTQRRLREMDILLDFSRKLSEFTPVGILRALLDSAMQILPAAQAGWAGLWDAKEQELLPQVAAGYSDHDSLLAMHMARPGVPGMAAADSLPLPLRVFVSGLPQREQEVQFARDYNLPPEDLLRYRQASGGRLPVSTMVAPIQLSEHCLGVLVLENFSSPAVFTEEDETISLALTQQAALALDNARLLQSAQQRAAQLQALTRVAGTITTSLRSEDLITSLLGQLGEILLYDTATLWLRQGDRLAVAAASGFEDDNALVGVSTAVEDSQLFREMVETGRPTCVPNIREDPRFPSLVEPDRISWLGIPLIAKGQLTGVIAVDKAEPDFYSEEHIQAATTFASQAAVALENARLFEESERRAAELDERSSRLALLNRLSGALGISLDAEYILGLTARELRAALEVSGAAVILLDPSGNLHLQTEIPSLASNLPLPLPKTAVFDHLKESRGLFNTSDAMHERGLSALQESFLLPRQICSLLVIPLLVGPELLGWLVLYTQPEYHFSLSEMELARTICNQAATAIQNARLFAETRRLTEDLERRVQERTVEVTREHHNSQTLLHIITELSASLDMGLVLNRTLGVLNESVGADGSMIVISQTGKTYQVGSLWSGGQDKNGKPSYKTEQEIARRVVFQRGSVVIEDIHTDAKWNTESEPPMYRSVLAAPLILGEDVLGSLLLFNNQVAFFTGDQMRLVEATARQIGISLNNADLFNLIRDQAEHLGGMLREQQVAASRSRAILEAVADGVLVTEANNTITLFNASAERILDLPGSQVVGKSLDQFSGLFGKAASTWLQTIRKWSEDTRSYHVGETFSEQLILDTGKVVSVHLAPVILRSEFLGTVSIFRDITHEVQVDRLKSEFVANVSHELRTPMTSIKGYVDIMLMGAAGELDPRAQHFLQVVKGNTERLSVLVNDLLDVSKIESGRVTLSWQAIDMREIAEDVISDINRRSREENKPMTFNLDIPLDLPRASGDLERVRQVLSNLVSNGYNYTPEGGKVTLQMGTEGQEIVIQVRDNGIGILPQDQRRIFERFYRGEDPLVLATAGTGLGLAITKSLVEMHNGKIWFSSTGIRGEGSVFSFSLPIYQQ